jgi:hypothetical protein
MRRRIRLLAPTIVVLVGAAEMLSLGAQDGLPIPETVVRNPRDPVEQQQQIPQQYLPAPSHVSRDAEDSKDARQWKPATILSSLTTPHAGPSESCSCVGSSCGAECGESCCYAQTPAACIECPHVTTLSPYFNLRFFGSLNAEMLFAESRPLLPSGVVLISPDFGKDTRTFEAHAKSTNLGIVFQGPKIGQFQSGGTFLSYLYGEQFQADRYGPYIVRAFGQLQSENLSFAAGLQGDLINPRSPTTLNFNAGNLAGNLGFLRSQFRVEHQKQIAQETQLTTQFALSNPTPTSFANFDRPPLMLLEDNGWPNLEARVVLGIGPQQGRPGAQSRPVEFAVSGLVGELRRTDLPTIPNHIIDVWAFGFDGNIALSDTMGVQGEFFTGQGIGNYNAGILQVDNDIFNPVRSTGGWAEFYCHWSSCLHSHVGYCVDDPLDRTVVEGLIAARPVRNQLIFANLIWDVSESLEIGFEVSHWETDYANITPVDISNDSMVYHTRVRLKF